MRETISWFVSLILLTGMVLGEAEFRITNVADLKEAIHSPHALEIVKKPETWLPELVASLQWKTLLSEHFILHYHADINEDQHRKSRELLLELEGLYSELSGFFDIQPTLKQECLALKTRLVCFVIRTQSERTFGTLPDPNILFYLLDPDKDPDYRVKLRHELAHWVWGRVYGEAPPLFNEGLAVYAEKLSAPGTNESEMFAGVTLESETLPVLREIASGDGFWQQKGMYTVGGLWTHFLVDRWGWAKLKEFFLETDFEDHQVLENFRAVYGESIDSVESEWQDYLLAKGVL